MQKTVTYHVDVLTQKVVKQEFEDTYDSVPNNMKVLSFVDYDEPGI